MSKRRNRYGGTFFYLSVGLISISVLMLEIGLLRAFSLMFDYHYAFLLISVAVLGLGGGGIFVHCRFEKISDVERYESLLVISSVLMALSILGMTIVIVKVSMFQHILLATPLVVVPFFFGGIFLSSAFRLFPHRSPQVYAADLIGASIGSLLVIFILELGIINLNLLVAFIACLPAGLLIFGKSSKKLEVAGLLFLIGGTLAIFLISYHTSFLGVIPLGRGAHKEMVHLLANPTGQVRVIDSRWSAFGRTDLVADDKRPDEMIFFVDGTAGTAMYRFNGDLSWLDKPKFTDFSGYFPFELLSEKEKEKVLIIGPGGGRDVLIALLGRAKEITAVEVNKDLVDLMKEYSNFNGGIYKGFPGIRIIVEEGRNFIRSTKEKYDIIMLTIPVTKTSRSPEGFALTENFLFTVESINDYLDRLKTNGRLIVVAHGDMEIFRLISTSLEALSQKGVSAASAMKHLYTVGPKLFPVFVLKNSPLTPEEAERVHLSMHRHGYLSLSSFIPFVQQVIHSMPLSEGIYYEHYMLNQALYLLSKGELSLDEVIENATFDLRAVTDNSPFFYNFDLGLPSVVSLLLVVSTIAIIWAWLVRRDSTKEEKSLTKEILFLLLFSFLGIGFMLIEIPLIQKFILFLGQPVYSMAILLFSLLIGAGMGSWISGLLWKHKTLFKLRIACLVVGLLVGTYVLFLNQLFDFFLGSPFFTRILVSCIFLMPLGFVSGMPFPLGLKLLHELDLVKYVPRMWGVNGIGSVLGSTLAIALAIKLGFSYAMILGAMLYFLIFIFSGRFLSGRT